MRIDVDPEVARAIKIHCALLNVEPGVVIDQALRNHLGADIIYVRQRLKASANRPIESPRRSGKARIAIDPTIVVPDDELRREILAVPHEPSEPPISVAVVEREAAP
jgi:hypothetical protein